MITIILFILKVESRRDQTHYAEFTIINGSHAKSLNPLLPTSHLNKYSRVFSSALSLFTYLIFFFFNLNPADGFIECKLHSMSLCHLNQLICPVCIARCVFANNTLVKHLSILICLPRRQSKDISMTN